MIVGLAFVFVGVMSIILAFALGRHWELMGMEGRWPTVVGGLVFVVMGAMDLAKA